MIINNEYEIIEKVLEELDFPKIEKCMIALDWTWGAIPKIPNQLEIYKEAKRMLNDLIKEVNSDTIKTFYYISCGGFTATYNYYGNNDFDIKIVFSITQGDYNSAEEKW